MLSESLAQDHTVLLLAAQTMRLIDTWKVLGPIVMIGRRDSNYYVNPDEIEGLLKNLCAEC